MLSEFASLYFKNIIVHICREHIHLSVDSLGIWSSKAPWNDAVAAQGPLSQGLGGPDV